MSQVKQVGGSHYQTESGLQHWDYMCAGHVEYLEGCASGYICRWRRKNGIEDLKKALSFMEKRLEIVHASAYTLINNPSTMTIDQVRQLGADYQLHSDEINGLYYILCWRQISDIKQAVVWLQGYVKRMAELASGTPEDGGHHSRQEDE